MNSTLIDYFKNQSFTKRQNRIAQYMVEHEYELPRMSLMDVSRAVGVSDASVLRFVREIDFEGWNDFKEKLYNRLAEQAEMTASAVKLSDRIVPGRNVLQDAAAESGARAMDSLLLNSQEAYDRIAEAMVGGSSVYVHGCRGTKAIAEHFAYALRFTEPRTNWLDSSHDVHAMLINSRPGDCLVFFCTSRFYRSDETICRHAAEAGVKLCLITDVFPSPISAYAAETLLAKTSNRNYFNSMLGVMAVAEYLLKLLSSGKPEEQLRAGLDAFDRATEDGRLI